MNGYHSMMITRQITTKAINDSSTTLMKMTQVQNNFPIKMSILELVIAHRWHHYYSGRLQRSYVIVVCVSVLLARPSCTCSSREPSAKRKQHFNKLCFFVGVSRVDIYNPRASSDNIRPGVWVPVTFNTSLEVEIPFHPSPKMMAHLDPF